MRKMDVTDDISVMNTVNRIISEAGQIGIVIHCAGFGIGGSVEDVPLDLAKQQMETNYFGVLRVNRQLLPHLRRQNQSLILVMSSVAGFISIRFNHLFIQ
jgi:NAD(P)-dependent dehydrogenase (short-subunit alcohol dehydrogenase family)